VVNVIEEPLDVSIYDVVDTSLLDDSVQGFECVMTPTAWPESIGAIQKVYFVDGIKDFGKRRLH
jgi:hypothetical protein